MAIPIPYLELVEQIPADETADITRIIEILQQTLRLHFEKTGQKFRDVHAKSNGCAFGEFRVLPELPPDLAQGLFAAETNYRAAVRFSNSSPWFQADIVPDARGLAIQVEDVPGDKLDSRITTQDFVLVNHPCFIVGTVKEFLQIEEARLRAGDNPLRLAATLAAQSWNPLAWNWRGDLALARVATQVPSHPASYTYYSMSPIRYGNCVAKYRIKPAAQLSHSTLATTARLAIERDALRHLLEKTLLEHDLDFEFQVQLRTSAESMPIEDASVTWSEEESPFQTVAHLHLPQQNLSAETRADFEQRAFNVWHALVAHRPLGGINRLRRVVYPVSAAFRQSQE